jgi:hypothetical protein
VLVAKRSGSPSGATQFRVAAIDAAGNRDRTPPWHGWSASQAVPDPSIAARMIVWVASCRDSAAHRRGLGPARQACRDQALLGRVGRALRRDLDGPLGDGRRLTDHCRPREWHD